jgi:FkbM family methyltransferase
MNMRAFSAGPCPSGIPVVDNIVRKIKRGLKGLLSRYGYEAPGLRLQKKVRIGTDLFHDIRYILGRDVRCVIDGGAHFGETALTYADHFGSAEIYSFEPDAEAFSELSRNAKGHENIHPICAALGEVNETALFRVNQNSQTNSFLAPAEDSAKWVPASAVALKEKRPVRVHTLDDFAKTIPPIDLLKLDVQGYELAVLRGAKELLTAGQIPLVYLEVCYVPQYAGQATLPELYDFLFPLGYRLVGLYPVDFDPRPFKYRVGGDLLFVHQSAAEATIDR